MPLTKSASRSAFQSNFLAEIHAGKPQKQALEIAYSTKRRAGGDKSASPKRK
jgi:hypothetical protein